MRDVELPGPAWDDDDARDAQLVARNAARLIRALQAEAAARRTPTAPIICAWHRELYVGCRLPSPQYAGAFRGALGHPDLERYEVGVGPLRPDGLPDRVGVWSGEVSGQVEDMLRRLADVLVRIDGFLPVGVRPTTTDEIGAVTDLIASVHGEWVRIHPFANGNGRTARVWAAWLALRYGLPVFVSVKPRPRDIGYASAARASMGRPPDFVGDHRATIGVFTDLLAEAMRQHRST